MPTYEQALEYLGIDYADDVVKNNVNRALATATKILQGAVGDDVLSLMPDDERVREMILIYTDDLYTNRGVSAKVSNAVRLSVASMELQVIMELRRLRKEAGA